MGNGASKGKQDAGKPATRVTDDESTDQAGNGPATDRKRFEYSTDFLIGIRTYGGLSPIRTCQLLRSGAREFSCFGNLIIPQRAPPGVGDQRLDLARVGCCGRAGQRWCFDTRQHAPRGVAQQALKKKPAPRESGRSYGWSQEEDSNRHSCHGIGSKSNSGE